MSKGERGRWAWLWMPADFVVVGGWGLAAFFVSRLRFARPSPFGDGDIFAQAVALARLIRGGGDLASFELTDQIFPVVFYSLPFTLFSSPATQEELWAAAVAWNHLWVLATLLLIRRAATRLGVAARGLWAVAPFLLYPLAFYYCYAIHAEIAGFVASSFVVWAWLATCRDQGESVPAVAAGLFVLASMALFLTRPSVGLAPVIALLLAVGVIRSGGPQARDGRILIGLLCLALLGVLATAALVKNLPAHERSLLGQERAIARTLLAGRFQFRADLRDWRYFGSREPDSPDLVGWEEVRRNFGFAPGSGPPRSKELLRWVRRDYLSQPLLVLRQTLFKLVFIHMQRLNSLTHSSVQGRPILAVLYWLLHIGLWCALAAVVVGNVVWLARRRLPELLRTWPLWGIWLSLALVHAMTYAEPKYLFPALPGIFLLTAAWVGPTIDRICSRST